MKRFLLATVFGGLGALSLFLTPGDAQPNTVKQIAPGVWFREGDIQQQGHCNNIIVEMKDYLIIVDANFPSGARLALEDAKKVSPKPVKYVFDTHHHGDHAYGNPVMTKVGAITLAYVGVAEEMKRYEPSRWRDTAKLAQQDVGELNLDAPEPPKENIFEITPRDQRRHAPRRVSFLRMGAHARRRIRVSAERESAVYRGRGGERPV